MPSTPRARLLADLRQLGPILRQHQGRQAQLRLSCLSHQLFQQGSPLMLRQLAQVDAIQFQQVVRHQHRRQLGQQFCTQQLAANAFLQCRERGRGIALRPDQDFAIDHRSLRQADGSQFGETLGNQILSARPQEIQPSPRYQLGAHAIVFPLDLPIGQIAQCRGIGLQGVRQEERIRLPAALRMLACRRRGNQLQETLRRRLDPAIGPAHQALRHQLAVHRRDCAERARDQQARYADAKAAADQLHKEKALARLNSSQ